MCSAELRQHHLRRADQCKVSVGKRKYNSIVIVLQYVTPFARFADLEMISDMKAILRFH